MIDLFSDEARRNPYPAYAQLREHSPVLRVPPPFNAWMLLDYESVKQALNDHQTFSSRVPAPDWFIFFDAPEHTKLRGLISRAFTPRMIAELEGRIEELSRELLDSLTGRGEIDLAAEYSAPLPMKVIAGMIGIPLAEWPRYQRWTDTILQLSYSRSGGQQAEQSLRDFTSVTSEMSVYLAGMIEARRSTPRDDLLSRLTEAEVDGQRLSHEEILAFFQLLILAGQETASNLLNNAVLCFIENPDQLARLRANPELLSSAIEEVLRYRSPLQWAMRTPRRDVEVQGVVIPRGEFVVALLGSANRDPKQFSEPDRFNITRNPNPHVAFGHGAHFCLGAALSRLEARIALTDLLERFTSFELATSDALPPRPALHVLGPLRLPISGSSFSGRGQTKGRGMAEAARQY